MKQTQANNPLYPQPIFYSKKSKLREHLYTVFLGVIIFIAGMATVYLNPLDLDELNPPAEILPIPVPFQVDVPYDVEKAVEVHISDRELLLNISNLVREDRKYSSLEVAYNVSVELNELETGILSKISIDFEHDTVSYSGDNRMITYGSFGSGLSWALSNHLIEYAGYTLDTWIESGWFELDNIAFDFRNQHVRITVFIDQVILMWYFDTTDGILLAYEWRDFSGTLPVSYVGIGAIEYTAFEESKLDA